MRLGKFEKVEIRDIWKNEASDFTKWLAEPENILLLSEELGLDELSVISTEKKIGNFSADILAETNNEDNKQTVIIENQLEITDHDHLGKLITYGSGVSANILIWIFSEIREEHRNAIDWLNEKTGDGLQLFAVKIEVWKIGDSAPAPKFDIICSPNNWANIVRQQKKQVELTDTKLNQLEFWNNFNEYIRTNLKKIKTRKPKPQHWYDISIGSSKLHVSCIVNYRENNIRCDIYIPKDKDLFNELFQKKDLLEKELGFNLEWEKLLGKEASRLRYQNNQVDLYEKSRINEYYNWFVTIIEKYRKVIPKYLQ